MPDRLQDDPAFPPPGTRSGTGSKTILPFLKRGRSTRPQVPTHPDDAETAPQDSQSPEPPTTQR
jgi:hypothetical protein